jgi:alpha-tubulin suppressor-like RCC1 family protein
MRVIALAVGVLVVGCTHYDGFHCTDSMQCAHDGVAGVCQSIGFCSFPDTSCASGQKFEAGVGDGLGDACVPKCGGAGEPCCEVGNACVSNAFCQAGTCSACVTDFTFGRRFMCSVKYDGTLWCSGANGQGQLGIGASSATLTDHPVQVRDMNGAPLTDVVSVGAGYDFACAVKMDGTVWCWGEDGAGQLGSGVAFPTPPATAPPIPWAVQVITTNDEPLTGAAKVVGGDDSACALLHTGGVVCWGEDNHGQLGDQTTVTRSKAASVSGLAGVAELAIGEEVACARTTTNNVYCWGNQKHGALFDGSTTDHLQPVMIANAASFATGKKYTCIVGPDSTITCAGWGAHGRLGIGIGESYEDGDHFTPVQTLTEYGGSPFTGVAQVAAGGVTCALMIDSTVYCWGDDTYGGTGTGTGSTVPTPVTFADGKPLTGVSRLLVHYQHACAITKAGELLCWGRNLQGELANGSYLNQGFPAPYSIGCP